MTSEDLGRYLVAGVVLALVMIGLAASIVFKGRRPPGPKDQDPADWWKGE